jgi:sialate O-acetylesterase
VLTHPKKSSLPIGQLSELEANQYSNKKFMRVFFISAVLLITVQHGFANIRLPKLFGNHMVLQREKPIGIWGWADPKEKITITLNKQSKSTTADKNGRWKIVLTPESAGGPYKMTVKGKNVITVDDILIGDVWVCSGQSNMEWPLSNTENSYKEIAAANYPSIRHIKIPNNVATEPLDDTASGEWMICDPQHAAEFTAVGYFFARSLHTELNVPIGLINSTWGGTNVESWTSRAAFENSDEFKEMITGMPHLDLDSIAKRKKEATIAKIEKLQGKLPGSEQVQQWSKSEFDDSSWRELEAPKVWEAQEPGIFDGVIWMRKVITLSAQQASQPATLGLAMIDDSDDTYVNGVKVGSTMQKWNEQRIYTIPVGTLKEGKNVIAIRIEDTGGGGGIHGDPSMMYLKYGNTSLPLSGPWRYRIESPLKNTSAVDPNSYPALLFNAMIYPLVPFSIQGVIWYQGENNAGRAYQYRKSFPLMINDWRNHWKQPDMPFYFVQLATFNSNNGNTEKGSTWAELREAQSLTLALPNTGMAVTTDIGDPKDIHPRNKLDVGKRLAALALNRTYGKTRVDSGPVFDAMKIAENRIVVSFKNTGSGLTTPDKYGYIKGFEIAGADKKFYYAKAFIEGNNVIVSSENVKEPLAVRYGWADDASDCNLYNKEGFPASPFRTDQWPGITEDAKYTF